MTATLTLAEVADGVAAHLDDIKRLFKPGAKVTVLVRRPEHEDDSQDFVLTDDDLTSAIRALRIRTKTRDGAAKCEGCGRPAVGASLDEVPLCERCGTGLEAQRARRRPLVVRFRCERWWERIFRKLIAAAEAKLRRLHSTSRLRHPELARRGRRGKSG